MAKTELEDDGVAVDPVIEASPEPMNYRDEVADDVRKTLAQLKGETPEKIETPEDVGEPPEPKKDERARDEEGKFAKEKPKKAEKIEEAAPVKAAPEQKSASTDLQAKVSIPASTPADAPPVGWTPDAKQAWAKVKEALPTLPAEVQASISAIQAAAIKREQDMSAGGRQWSEEKRQYETILSPVVEASRKHGISADEGVKRLMAANDLLERDAPSAIRWLAQSYGVDLTALVSNSPAPQPQRFVDPMVPQLTDKVSTLESQLNGFLQSQTLGVVESFASTHPHYAAVEDNLLQIIPFIQQQNPGLAQAEVLQKAYDQAIWLNPDVRTAILAEQRSAEEKANADKIAEAEKQRVATTQNKAVQSKKAAVSIKGSSTGVSPPPKVQQNNGGGDVYSDVRAAINQLKEAAM